MNKKFFSLITKHLNAIYWVMFIFVIISRIWLITGVPKMFIYGPHDDLFYARASQSIIRGQWMGLYGEYTLIKGPFYSFFLIFSFLTGFALYLNETLFYIGACLVLYFAVEPIIKNRWLRFLLLTIMLFLPSSMPNWFHLRVYREFVYFSLTLYVTAFSIGLLLRSNRKLATLIVWSVGLGLSMGAFLLTREEGVWILPILVLLLICCLFKVWKGNRENPILRTIILVSTIIIWYLPTVIVSWLNYSHYGYWGVTEQLDAEFNRVLVNLGRIETEYWHPSIQIPKEARLAAYEVSPSLNQFQEQIERYVDSWNPADDGAMALKPRWFLDQYGNGGDEIGNGHFLWLLRGVIVHNGYYADGNYPRYIYQEIADELEQACDSGLIACKNKSLLPAMAGSISQKHLPIIYRMFTENFVEMISLDSVTISSLDVNRSWPSWPEGNDEFWVFEQFSYNPVDTIQTVADDDLPKNIYGVIDLRYRSIIIKAKIMSQILNLYKIFSTVFFIFGLFSLLALVVILIIWKEVLNYFDLIAVPGFALALVITRLLVLTIIDATTSIPAIQYGASLQIFLPIFTFCSIFGLVWMIKNHPIKST